MDAQNTALGGPDTFELRPGTGRSFELRAERSMQVRPVVVDLRPQAECSLVVTAEVLDQAGAVEHVVNWTPVQ